LPAGTVCLILPADAVYRPGSNTGEKPRAVDGLAAAPGRLARYQVDTVSFLSKFLT